MVVLVRMPKINANDDSAEIISWAVNEKSYVKKGDVVCVVETTKSAVDVLADADGFLNKISTEGLSYAVGYPIAYICSAIDYEMSESDINKEIDSLKAESPLIISDSKKWTKKAEIKAKKFGIDINALYLTLGKTVSEEDVVSVGEKPFKNSSYIADFSQPLASYERVLILGGAGGAALAVDILSRVPNQKPVLILDNNHEMIGGNVYGVPIVGGFEKIDDLWSSGAFDSVISTIVRSVDERKQIFEKITAKGIPFTNVIDPNVRIGLGCTLGKGNLIIYGSYLAASVELGDNNFLAAHTSVEHHSIISSHCTFGPRSTLAGGVTICERVKIGTQVAIEPQIRVGEGSTIASGVVLTSNLEADCIAKSTSQHVVRGSRK